MFPATAQMHGNAPRRSVNGRCAVRPTYLPSRAQTPVATGWCPSRRLSKVRDVAPNRAAAEPAGRGRAVWPAAAAGYVLLACFLTWPLVLHLRTHLIGDPSGDLGNYVWNFWVFRHELIRHGHLPFSTGHVLAYAGGTDFSLHNYAPLAGALGLPLIGTLGVVGAFNVVLISCIALSGQGAFVLAKRLGVGSAAAWWAGALFMASPVLTAKETAHFSLVIAASLPLFLWALLRTLDTGRKRDAVLLGAIVAVASYSDAYYGIYCATMGAFIVVWRFSRMEWLGPSSRS